MKHVEREIVEWEIVDAEQIFKIFNHRPPYNGK